MEKTSTAKRSRSYNSTRRAKQASQTKQDVVAAAIQLFGTVGWSGATVAAIAEHAGVAVETVYKGFGSKKQLLRAAMEVAVVGDAEPVPFADRPEFTSLGVGTREERAAKGARIARQIHERSAGVWQALVEAASGDDEIDRWRRELEHGRRVDVGRSAAAILGEPPDEQLVTMAWILFGPEVYRKLVDDDGLDAEAYEAFLVEAMNRLAGSPATPEARR